MCFYMSEDAKLYGDVDFRTELLHMWCITHIIFISVTFCHYSKGVKPLNMTSNIL